MRFSAFIIAILALGAGTALAMPPIVIYNYAPPAPVLEVVSTSPQDHQQMNSAPDSVRVSFSQSVDPGSSDIKVFDPYNNPLTVQKTNKDTSVSVSLPSGLTAGTYRAEWQATCSCKAHTALHGTFYFTII